MHLRMGKAVWDFRSPAPNFEEKQMSAIFRAECQKI